VRLFFPDLPAFEEFTISGSYNKTDDEIDFNLSMPGITYNSVIADSLNISINGNSEKLKFLFESNLEVGELMTGKFNILGNFDNSELMTTLRYFDSYSNKYIDLTAKVDTADNSFIVNIIPDSLIFSYDRWEINPNNSFTINSSSFSVKNFELKNIDQKISISSFPETDAQNLKLELNPFNLGSLEKLFALDTLVAGKAHANFNFSNLYKNLSIEGDLSINDFVVQGFDAGKLSISDIEFNSDTASFVAAVTGDYEDINMSAKYYFKNDIIDAEIDIDRLDLSDLNYLLSDYIVDAKGGLKGIITVNGSTQSPILNGDINFKNAGVGIVYLNNYFTLGTESISIENNVLKFDDFSISNRANQSARIYGHISIDPEMGTYTNLHIKTDDMEIMSSNQKEKDILFGFLKAQANIDIVGPQDNIKVDANLMIDGSTDVTYVFPESLSVNDNNGIVKFGKYEHDSILERRFLKNKNTIGTYSFENIKAQIEINDGAQFKIFFDSEGKDFLDASLNGTMNYILVEDNSEISGMFDIDKGKLHYGIPMVTVDEYNIEPGSYIALSNDVYNPHVNIVASSSVRASTDGLIADYNRVMDFKILLYMSGELNNVKLRFDISTEVNDAIVSSKLSQLTAKERNVNALNLLARGSFIISVQGSEAGGTSMASAQVDKFYASQLNHLISDNISFVDLHFDVQSFTDYGTSGEQIYRRNYYYNIGKSFFKNRARISYKGSLGFTSDIKAEQINSNFVQNNLEVELKIAKDGHFRGVFFRKNKYEGLLDGEVVETGGGLRFKKSYYSFKDIFTKDKVESEK
jgi:hypothetical protein